MGAWGPNTFDNDAACDWTYDLEKTRDLRLVRETLARVEAVGAKYLEAAAASQGLAACEALARLRGKWGLRNAYTEALDAWVNTHKQDPPGDLVEQGVRVIDRVLTAPSELLELWSEGDSEDWQTAVADLRKRLTT